MAENEAAAELPRDQVISLIGRHTKQLADLAQSHGFERVYYHLQMAAQRAEKDLNALRPERARTGT
jgi:hypothetical protein